MPKISWISPETKVPGTRNQQLVDAETIAATLINGGMTLDFDPTDMPDDTGSLVVNARVRRDKTTRRDGTSQFLDRKIDPRPVSAVIPFRISGQTTYFVRTTDFDVQFITDSALDSWTILAGNKLNGRLTDHAVVLGTLVLADGIGKLQLADLSDETLEDLGEIAPTAKHVTGFSERVVAANGGMGSAPSETVYWSGNRNFSEFDALEDISAGQKRLDTSPRTVVDPISGIFGFSSVMVIPREASIWVAQQNPVASDPFKFFRAIPGVGTNLSGSIAIGRELLMFLDSRMRDLVVYTPGSNVETIGLPVRNTILATVANADFIFSTYLISEQEYYIAVAENGTVKIWIFNFITKAWTYDERPLLTSLNVVDGFSDYTSFDDLTGTFDALAGTFDELSVTPVEVPKLIFGFDNGKITQEDPTKQDDESEGAIAGTPLVETFEFEFRSKEFKEAKTDITVNRLEIEYQATVDGVVTLEFSKNGGETFILAKSVPFTTGKVNILKFKKQIKTRRFMWRVRATTGKFDLLGYELDIIGSGESRK